MSTAIDMNVLLREAVTLALAHHIETRLAQAGCKLLRGSAMGHAKWLVSRWTDANVRAFYVLAKAQDRFWSHTQLAHEAKSSAKATRDFWSRTLKGSQVAARLVDSVERQEVKLFRRGKEMWFSNLGIKLQLATEMLRFDLARIVTNSTMGQTLALRQNYEGACEAQEADASKSEEERAEARERLDGELARPEVVRVQERLFGTDS